MVARGAGTSDYRESRAWFANRVVGWNYTTNGYMMDMQIKQSHLSNIPKVSQYAPILEQPCTFQPSELYVQDHIAIQIHLNRHAS